MTTLIQKNDIIYTFESTSHRDNTVIPVFYRIDKVTTDKIFTTPLYSEVTMSHSNFFNNGLDEKREMQGHPITDEQVVKCKNGHCTEFNQCEVCDKNEKQKVTPGKKSFYYTEKGDDLNVKKRSNSKDFMVFYKYHNNVHDKDIHWTDFIQHSILIKN